MNFFQKFKQYKKFTALPKSHREIVFYSEGDFQWQYFEGIINILCKQGYKICYITSDEKDRGYTTRIANLNSFCIGSSWLLTLFFLNLDTKILLMSLPDLDVFHIKKSKIAQVHYAYIFHACVSTHMMYREQAFDNFDSIFCVGSHHLEEISKGETMLGLKKKLLITHGIQRMDDIIKNLDNKLTDNKTILIAPSWGESALIESGECKKIIRHLIKKDFKIILRPHPETKKLSFKIIAEIQDEFKNYDNFIYDDSIYSTNSLQSSALMITDSSGIIFDYGLGYLKPVIFIKKCYKIKNDKYKELGLEPVEIAIRKDIGIDYQEETYENLGQVINELIKKHNSDIEKINSLRQKYIFNIGHSAEVGAERILNILKTL